MTTWQPIVSNGNVTIPRKGARVRIAEHYQTHLASLPGAQMKLGARHIPETIGTMLDAQGIGRTPGARPEAVEFTVALDDGATRVITLPFAPESLARVSVAAEGGA